VNSLAKGWEPQGLGFDYSVIRHFKNSHLNLMTEEIKTAIIVSVGPVLSALASIYVVIRNTGKIMKANLELNTTVSGLCKSLKKPSGRRKK
jgi:hypothetical protein